MQLYKIVLAKSNGECTYVLADDVSSAVQKFRDNQSKFVIPTSDRIERVIWIAGTGSQKDLVV